MQPSKPTQAKPAKGKPARDRLIQDRLTRGFTLIELALVLVILGLISVPLLRALDKAQQRRQGEATATALQNAKDALLAYAVQHRGCLPLAADYEGGMPDTGREGLAVGNNLDTGRVRSGIVQRAGDMPWSALALAGRGLSGQQLRLQYFVASAFTGDACPARARNGIEIWQNDTIYSTGDIVIGNNGLYVANGTASANIGPPSAPWQLFANGAIRAWRNDTAYATGDYVTDSSAAYRALANNSAASPATSPALWRAVGLPGQSVMPSWQSGSYSRGEIVSHNQRLYRANAATSAAVPNTIEWTDLSLPALLLQTRLGPLIDSAPGSTLASAQNIAILLAPGRGANATLNRTGVRAASHRDCPASTACTPWTTLNDANVDTRAFSLTPAAAGNPALAETILPVSLADYQMAMARAGLSMQAVRW